MAKDKNKNNLTNIEHNDTLTNRQGHPVTNNQELV